LVGTCQFVVGLFREQLRRIRGLASADLFSDIASAVAARPAAIIWHVCDSAALRAGARAFRQSGRGVPLIAVACSDELREQVLRLGGVRLTVLGPECPLGEVARVLASALRPSRGRQELLATVEAEGAPRGVTQRQCDVLRLAARGWTSDRIARSLHLSKRTVEAHRSNMLRRLGVGSISEAVAEGMRRGIID
jgi:DNA-binding NarL/FixJ family response regulator